MFFLLLPLFLISQDRTSTFLNVVCNEVLGYRGRTARAHAHVYAPFKTIYLSLRAEFYIILDLDGIARYLLTVEVNGRGVNGCGSATMAYQQPFDLV